MRHEIKTIYFKDVFVLKNHLTFRFFLSMKYVKDKPVRDFTGDQFLKLCMAEEENLLTITINGTIEGNTTSSYIDEVKQLYIRVNVDFLVSSPYSSYRFLCFRTNLVRMFRTGMPLEWSAWRGR